MPRIKHLKDRQFYHFINNKYGVSGYYPWETIPSMDLFLIADAGLVMNGTSVSRWNNMARFPKTVSYANQTTPEYQPLLVANQINGHNILRFTSASATRMSMDGTIICTTSECYFGVIKRTGSYAIAFGNTSSAPADFAMMLAYRAVASGSLNLWSAGGAVGNSTWTNSNGWTSYQVIFLTCTALNTYTLTEDTTVLSPTTTVNGALTAKINMIGGFAATSWLSDMDVACLGHMTTVPTTGEKETITNYLKTYYNL